MGKYQGSDEDGESGGSMKAVGGIEIRQFQVVKRKVVIAAVAVQVVIQEILRG